MTGAAAGVEATPQPAATDGLPVSALTVSVVICTWTGARWRELREAVESVGRQSHQPLETIVYPRRMRKPLPASLAVVGLLPPEPSLNTLRTPIDGKSALSRFPRLFM